MKYSNFCKLLGKLETNTLTLDEAQSMSTVIQGLMDALNELDMEDALGTEGWKHYMGME